MSEETSGRSRQPRFPEAILGRVLWHVYVPSVSYGTFSAAQKLAGRRLKQQLRRKLMPMLIISWLAVFLGTLALTSIYDSVDPVPVMILIGSFLLLLIVYTAAYQGALYKKVYASGVYDNFTLFIGENGILLESDALTQFHAWRLVESVFTSQHAILMLTRSCLLIIIPEADVPGGTDRDAMLAFIETKIAGATDTAGSSRPAEG
jgi:hypothetical protein